MLFLEIDQPEVNMKTDVKKLWKLIDNKNGNFCASYPQYLIVPLGLSLDEVRRVTAFRTSNRLPILSYVFRTQQNKKFSLWRSSQNKVKIYL